MQQTTKGTTSKATRFIFVLLVLCTLGAENPLPPQVESITDVPHPEAIEEPDTGIGKADASANRNEPVICLSPGHPSYDGDKYYEAVINRKVAWLLKYRLVETGYAVAMAVEDLMPTELFFSNQGNEDEVLWENLTVMTPEEKANRCNDAGADFVISIHHNYSYHVETNQTMVFYTLDDVYRPVHKEAKTWAETTAEYLGKVMKTSDSYAIADMERLGFQLGILSNSNAPGILTEASFYSNPEERRRLNDDTYLIDEAEAIFRAFVAHFENTVQ